MIIFSYVPLLSGPPGLREEMSREDAAVLAASLDELPSGGADSCVWVRGDDGTPSPVLVLEHGDEIHEHLVAWSEGSPADWFDVQFLTAHGLYGIALVPRVQKSVDRHLAARAILYGLTYSPPECSIVFRPLRFVSRPSPWLLKQGLIGSIGNRIKVGILDRRDLAEDVPSTDFKKARMIGPFNVVRDPVKAAYLGSVLEDAAKEHGSP